jgi:hypothetical protein
MLACIGPTYLVYNNLLRLLYTVNIVFVSCSEVKEINWKQRPAFLPETILNPFDGKHQFRPVTAGKWYPKSQITAIQIEMYNSETESTHKQ